MLADVNWRASLVCLSRRLGVITDCLVARLGIAGARYGTWNTQSGRTKCS